MPSIIGISGRKKSGKSTVAQMLIEKLKPKVCIEMGFADALYEEVAKAIFPQNSIVEAMLPENINYIKRHKDNFRLILQGWGTDYRRKLFGEDYWVKKMAARILPSKCDFIIVPDVRFLNEARSLTKIGALLIRVNRPEQEYDSHISETELNNYKGFHYLINNVKSLIELDHEVDMLLMNKGYKK